MELEQKSTFGKVFNRICLTVIVIAVAYITAQVIMQLISN